MKIACLDKSAAFRIQLQQFVEGAYLECRSALGHLPLNQIYPATSTELLLNSAPDAAILGSGYSADDALLLCRSLREKFPDLPLFTVLSPDQYNLRMLRRFERLNVESFSVDDPKVRLVHKLVSIRKTAAPAGQLLVLTGVKGGVGATSVAAAFAHAAETISRSSIVVDLSYLGVLSQYLGSQRWQSADYASALSEPAPLSKITIQRCISTAPNGINILLPPGGGHEIRELWLRDCERFEVSLNLIDQLRELYDVIIVDLAGAEGVLPFALLARADIKILLTSNEAASVHLLNTHLTETASFPGDSRVRIVINCTFPGGLKKDDIIDFLYTNEHFEPAMTDLPVIPFDPSGRNWIGTGNSFYTESCGTTQAALEECLRRIIAPAGAEQLTINSSLLCRLKRLASRVIGKNEKVEPNIKALPGPTGHYFMPRPEDSDGPTFSTADQSPERAFDRYREPWLHIDAPSAPAGRPNLRSMPERAAEGDLLPTYNLPASDERRSYEKAFRS